MRFLYLLFLDENRILSGKTMGKMPDINGILKNYGLSWDMKCANMRLSLMDKGYLCDRKFGGKFHEKEENRDCIRT